MIKPSLPTLPTLPTFQICLKHRTLHSPVHPRIHTQDTGGFAQTPHHRVQTEWQRPPPGVHSIMMEKLAQAGEGGECTPTPCKFIYNHIQSCSVHCTCTPAERTDTLTLFHLYPYMYSMRHTFIVNRLRAIPKSTAVAAGDLLVNKRRRLLARSWRLLYHLLPRQPGSLYSRMDGLGLDRPLLNGDTPPIPPAVKKRAPGGDTASSSGTIPVVSSFRHPSNQRHLFRDM